MSVYHLCWEWPIWASSPIWICKVMCDDRCFQWHWNESCSQHIKYMLATLDTASNITLGGPNRLVTICSFRVHWAVCTNGPTGCFGILISCPLNFMFVIPHCTIGVIIGVFVVTVSVNQARISRACIDVVAFPADKLTFIKWTTSKTDRHPQVLLLCSHHFEGMSTKQSGVWREHWNNYGINFNLRSFGGLNTTTS